MEPLATGERLEVYGNTIFERKSEPSAVRERERLQSLADALDGQTVSVTTRLQMPERPRCLVVGAGLGTVCAKFAQILEADVLGTDLDLRFLGNGDWGGFRSAILDVTKDDLGGSYDFISARWVLSHLRQRDHVLRRLVEALAPGGWLLIEEPCREPLRGGASTPFRLVSNAMCDAIQVRIGSDLDWAAGLDHHLAAAGLVDVQLECYSPRVTPDSAMGRFWLETAYQLLPAMTELGLEPSAFQSFERVMLSGDIDQIALSSISSWGRRHG